jgi:hypothetical protein
MSEKKVKTLVNRNILARELGVSKSRLYRACESGALTPDFLMEGQPIYFAHRITAISKLLKLPNRIL